MSEPAPLPPPLRTTRVLAAARETYLRHPRTMLGVGVGLAIGYYVIGLVEQHAYAGSEGRLLVGEALALAILYLVQTVAQALLVDVIVADHDGRPVTARGLLGPVGPRLNELFTTAILAALGVAVLSLFLAIPGLIAVLLWSFVAPVVMLENLSGLPALRRSGEHLRGNFWRMVGLYLLVSLILLFFALIVDGILHNLFGYAGDIAADALVGIVLGPFSALAPVIAYFQIIGTVAVPSMPEIVPVDEPAPDEG